MEKVRCPVQVPPFPLTRVGLDNLGLDLALPVFDLLLFGSHVFPKGQAGGEGTDKGASMVVKGIEERPEHPGLHENVVVEVQNVSCRRPLEKEMALLGYSFRGKR